jgi:hypothetical protein
MKQFEFAPYKWIVTIKDPININTILIQRKYQYLEDIQHDLNECFTYNEVYMYSKEKYISIENIIEFKQIYEKY